jgi:hypothetical protein
LKEDGALQETVLGSSCRFDLINKPPERDVIIGEFVTFGCDGPTLFLCEFECDKEAFIQHGARQAGDMSVREFWLNQEAYVSVAIVRCGLELWNVFTVCTLRLSQSNTETTAQRKRNTAFKFRTLV